MIAGIFVGLVLLALGAGGVVYGVKAIVVGLTFIAIALGLKGD